MFYSWCLSRMAKIYARDHADPNQPVIHQELPDPPLSEISISQLIDDGLLVLYREIRNLKMLSAKGKLDANSARDLRDHIKLLFELKDREKDALKGLTEEQLEELVKKTLSEKT